MAKLYLITGFLGAGKTTFLKRLTACFEGQKLALVVNDFGREQVDGTLMRQQGYVLQEINNGSIFCACRAEQFEMALEQVLIGGPEVILVEASGLSDPTNIATILASPALEGLTYAGALCLVDAARFHKVKDTALVTRQQLATADGVIINKTDLATAEQLDTVYQDIAELCPGVPVLETSFGAVTAEWIATVSRIPRENQGKAPHKRDITFQKLTLELESGLTRDQLDHILKDFTRDTYRVKGFVALPEGIVLVSCAGSQIEVSPWTGEVTNLNQLTILYGNGLPAKTSLKRAIGGYPNCHILTM